VKEAQLPEEFRMLTPSALDGKSEFADVRMGWNEQGLAVSVRVHDKKQHVWCHPSRPDDSDGLHLFVATRDIRTIHRANRFCHYFVCCPSGGDTREAQPFATMLPIQRAKDPPKAISASVLKVRSEKRIDGYLLRAWIPSSALTGYDPEEHRQLGFFYVVRDRELGWQTFAMTSDFPIISDPSLWGELELRAS
jgi:hypothetical protein